MNMISLEVHIYFVASVLKDGQSLNQRECMEVGVKHFIITLENTLVTVTRN